MVTSKRYLADPTTTSGTVTVTAILEGERPAVRLSETWFHPQGGGQKADRGTIGTANVTHVAHNDGDVDHFVDNASQLKIGQTYPFQLDTNLRGLNAAYHTTGHLIASIVESKFPEIKALAGHQWPGEARVEFDGGSFGDFARLQTVLAEEIQKNIDAKTLVAVIGDPYAARAIKIGDYTPIPCGGTHVQAISDIGRVNIESIKRKSGKIRVSYCVL